MTDHTPTTEEVRDEWAYGNQEVDYEGNPVITLDEAFAQFDRWLVARDRKIAAEALRDFADTLGVNVGDEDDEWWRGYRQGQREALHKASDRADRIERGGES